MPSITSKIFSRRMLIIFLMGFASGLPLLLTLSTMKAWMTDLNTDLTKIGLFSGMTLPYTLKFLWAPLMDRYTLPFLGRRRGWMLTTQVALLASIAGLGLYNPLQADLTVAILALLISFFSASQDIVIDAYRREYLTDEELGLGSSMSVNGYRLGMYVSGGGAMLLTSILTWNQIYIVMAGLMAVGIVTVLIAPEPAIEVVPPRSLQEAVVSPFLDFFGKPGAVWMLAFILLYKVGDSMASDMTTPMYKAVGYNWVEVGAVVKSIALWAGLVGGTIGGALMIKIGIKKALWIFGAVQAISTLGFAVLAASEHSLVLLSGVILFEHVSGGMGTAALTAFMASLTSRRFSGTQLALLSSFMGVPRTIFGMGSGALANQLGWIGFFVFCTLIAVPGLLLLVKIAPWADSGSSQAKARKHPGAPA